MTETIKYVTSHDYVHGQHDLSDARRRAQADEAFSGNTLERGSTPIDRRAARIAGTRQSSSPQQQVHREGRERAWGLGYAQSSSALPKVVVVANILFSALIRNSSVRALIFRYPSEILTPAYFFEEL